MIETQERNQQWLGVADIMKAEAHEEANPSPERAAGCANGQTGITPERVVRGRQTADEILGLIEDDVHIAILVLAAAQSKEGPALPSMHSLWPCSRTASSPASATG